MNKRFLSCDWGTSSFRLRLIDVDSGTSISHLSSKQGIAHAFAQWQQPGQEDKTRMHFYLGMLQQYSKKIAADAAISPEDTPIIISGMASSSIGMLELDYTAMPFAITGEDLKIKKIRRTDFFPHEIVLISGARTNTDVMRGEETQLIGCAGNNTGGRQIFIFPGTHSKHIITAGGKAIGLETYMTGEFFDLLTKKSILSGNVASGGDIDTAENKNAFVEGVQESTRENLLHSSFKVRTNQLFGTWPATANYFYFSGLLIGTELYRLSAIEADSITVIADKKLQVHYLLALQQLAIKTKIQTADAAAATIQGQLAIYKRVYG